ncbi:MAG: Na+/H+ antiporter NhaA, partial [Candidatus Binatia bacterium]
ILVIAIFYTANVSLPWLAAAIGCVAAIAVLRLLRLPWPVAYVPFGIAAWVATFESGIHPTIAGVAIALITPARQVRGRPVLRELEHRLHPISSYLIVPVFALANAGVVFAPDVVGDAVRSPIFWGIPLGLVVGKTLGIGSAALVSVRLRAARLPIGVEPRHVLGAGALGGIGFTVSLFITNLAFRGDEATDVAKMGVLLGSTVAAVVGVVLLARTTRLPGEPATAPEGPSRD